MTIREALDRGCSSELGALVEALDLGSFLSALSTPVTTAELAVTSHVLVLPAVALHIDIVEATEGSVVGVKTVQLADTPATTFVKLGSDGRTLTFNSGTDAVTKAKVRYVPVPTQAANLAAAWRDVA